MERIPAWFLEACAVLFILLLIVSYLFGPETLFAAAQQNLSQPITLSMIDSKIGIERPEIVGNNYFYDITLTPQLSVIGSPKQDQDIIAIIRFKDHSERAVINTNKDFFTVSPDDKAVEPILHTSFFSEVPPITAYNQYSNELKENQKILLKTDTGAVLASVSVYRTDTPLPDVIDEFLTSCKAVFEFEGGCAPGKIKYTTPMTGTECDKTPSSCEQSIDICSGTANVMIFGEPDCVEQKVTAEITYRGGEKFDAGETVLVSFWKKTACTEGKSDFRQMLVLCPEDIVCPDGTSCTEGVHEPSRVGGEYSLNAGIIKGFDI